MAYTVPIVMKPGTLDLQLDLDYFNPSPDDNKLEDLCLAQGTGVHALPSTPTVPVHSIIHTPCPPPEPGTVTTPALEKLTSPEPCHTPHPSTTLLLPT